MFNCVIWLANNSEILFHVNRTKKYGYGTAPNTKGRCHTEEDANDKPVPARRKKYRPLQEIERAQHGNPCTRHGEQSTHRVTRWAQNLQMKHGTSVAQSPGRQYRPCTTCNSTLLSYHHYSMCMGNSKTVKTWRSDDTNETSRTK